MRRRTLLLGALPTAYAATMPAAASAAPAGDPPGNPAAGRLRIPVRVATYNIHAGIGSDRRFDIDRQIAEIRTWDADIIGLQEVDIHWSGRSRWRDLVTELSTGLGMNAYFGHIYDLAPPGEGRPRRRYGLATLSRYPIIYAHNHSITRLSSLFPGGPELMPGSPEVVVNVDGAHLHVHNTHLDYRGDPRLREIEVVETLEIMDRAEGRQQVLLGDFNAPPHAPELAPFWERLTDTWAAVHGDADGYTFRAADPVKRIDYVTVTPGIEVRAARVPATLASDHLPVVADLVITRGLQNRA